MFFSCSKVLTLIHSLNLVYRIYNFEKNSFVINVEILDKNDILLAVTIPTGAMPDIVDPLPALKPAKPNKISETNIKIFFFSKLLYYFL